MTQDVIRAIGLAIFFTQLGACASGSRNMTTQHGAWGAEATVKPGWSRLGAAAKRALRDPQTWVPAAGATLFLVTDWDQSVSAWATREHPLFGSQLAASNASDDMRDIAKYGALATALLTPNGNNLATTANGKLKGIGLQIGASVTTGFLTGAIKTVTDRPRPNGSNNRSFPSGHASGAFVGATLARRNVAISGYSDTATRILDIGFFSMGAGTAWARVEAGVHYPSDVLAGAALGHFVAAVVNDAFIDTESAAGPRMSLQLGRTSGQLTLRWPLR